MGQFLNYFKWLIYSNTFAHLCNRILLIHSRKIKLYIENTNIHVHTCTNDVTSVIIHIQNISTIKFSTVFKCQYTCGNICNQNTILLNLNIADNLYINCFVIEEKQLVYGHLLIPVFMAQHLITLKSQLDLFIFQLFKCVWNVYNTMTNVDKMFT